MLSKGNEQRTGSVHDRPGVAQGQGCRYDACYLDVGGVFVASDYDKRIRLEPAGIVEPLIQRFKECMQVAARGVGLEDQGMATPS